MCWFTLTPTKGGKKKHRHSHSHSHHSAESSCVEEIVRVHRSPSPRFTDVRVKVPSSITVDLEDHHHHNHHLHPHLLHHHHKHPHLHPLHLNPLHGLHHHHHDLPSLRLGGPGRKRCPPAPPSPPPPSRNPSRTRRPYPPSPSSPSSEPIYRTQIVEPAQVRETTRVALRSSVQLQSEERESRPRGGRLRRVAGYEVLGRDVPWNWECVSSTVGSERSGGGGGGGKRVTTAVRRKGGGGSGSGSGSGLGLRYPPFGTMERWL